MSLSVFLLSLELVLLLALGAAVGLLWRRVQRLPQRSEPASQCDWQPAFTALQGRCERQLSLALGLAETRLIEQLARPVHSSPLAEAPAPTLPHPRSPATADVGPPAAVRPADLHPAEVSRQLEEALNVQDFLEEVWPGLLQDFFTCKARVADFLRSKGLPHVEIKAHPTLRGGNPNYWEFMLAEPRQRSADSFGLLIPRSYGRFDPSFHGHLFNVHGPIREADTFFRHLLRCALLRSTDGANVLDKDLVIEKGVFAVTPPGN